MATQRTTLILDEASQKAARAIAHKLKCSTSEAIRRAVVGYRDSLVGTSPELRARRKQTLKRLFELFEGNDAEDEVRRLKREDEGF
jgi:hypothetical protein